MVGVFLDAGVEEAGLLGDLVVEFFNLADEELFLSWSGGLKFFLERGYIALQAGDLVGDGLALG